MRETVRKLERWRFLCGDAATAARHDFDDATWREVGVPHDWSFEQGPTADGDQGPEGGYYSGGIGWYRHTFLNPGLAADQQLWVRFDGLYMNSEVWLNGESLGRWANGYRTIEIDLTPALRPGENVLAVRCDNTLEPSARWTHPCGVYAPVQLFARPCLGIRDVFAYSTQATAEQAVVVVSHETTADGRGQRMEYRLIDSDGVEVARAVSMGEGVELQVDRPRRWSVDAPSLYTLRSSLFVDGLLADQLETRVGLREVRWCADSGFWLNGKNLKIKGVCEHWEGGPVGGAWTPAMLRWKLETLQAMGCNSIRTAHNPFPPFFYDLCDEMGILVLSEFFDGWKRKARHDYGEQAFANDWESDLRATLRRDRNHPCIVLWSIGNETEGAVARDLVRVCHEEDPSRMVTSGNAEPQHMDVVGLNGPSERRDYLEAERQIPDKPMVAAEAPHTWQVRGYYRTKSWFRDGYPNARQSPFPLPDLTDEEVFVYDWADPRTKTDPIKQVFNSSYDNAMVRITARQNWAFARDLAWHAGHYRWTGFDYPGEAGYVHGGWPFRAFMGGTHDLAGFPKDLAYFYQSQWTRPPMVHLLPHWTHPRTLPGTVIPVWAYSNAQEVELYLNGRSLGVRTPGTAALEMQCEWMVPWEPGELVAIARAGAAQVAKAIQATAGPPARLRCECETREAGLRIISTSLVDEDGWLAPYADNRVHFSLSPTAARVHHENGNPVDVETGVAADSRRAFMGLLRSFIEINESQSPAVLTLGAILGSRNGVTGPDDDRATVSISVVHVPLNADTPRSMVADGKVHFTTDGRRPTPQDAVYDQPFVVRFPATVRALVVIDKERSLEMREDFGSDQGLFWPSGDAAHDSVGFAGTDADLMTPVGQARVDDQRAGYHGGGYVRLSKTGDGVSWYQENDGDEGEATLRLRFACPSAADDPPELVLVVNGETVETFTPAGSDLSDWQVFKTRVTLKRGGNELSLGLRKSGQVLLDRVGLV